MRHNALDFSYTSDAGQTIIPARITLHLGQNGSGVSGTWTADDGVHAGTISFSIGGLDLMLNFTMTDGGNRRWFHRDAHHIGDPAIGPSITIDLFGQDGHGSIVHTWFPRRVLFRPVVP